MRRLIYPDAEPAYRRFCAWRTVVECEDPDPVFRLSTTTGSFLGSFPAGPALMYAFLLAHYPEPPALPPGERLARLKELAAADRGDRDASDRCDNSDQIPSRMRPPARGWRLTK